jgi:hypothetical protein
MLREPYTPMNLFDLVPALCMEGYFSGRPPGLASGTRCRIKSHALPLRSVG